MLNLTQHEKDVIALCLSEYADHLDQRAQRLEVIAALGAPDQLLPVEQEVDRRFATAVQSTLTAEMRDIAFRVEWER